MELILVTSPDCGRAAMAAAFFNGLVTPSIACSIAAVPDPQMPIDPLVKAAFEELDTGRALLHPSRLTAELVAWGMELIHLGAASRSFGFRNTEWDIADPAGQPIEEIRAIRDAIQRNVETLLAERGWLRAVRGRARN
jgi:arsenate reductase